MNEKISVIIPIYNDEKYLQECLDSVMNQTFKDFECICVDDCSTDGSVEIIETYRKKDNRIKCIKHEKNMSVSNSRYTGLLNAKAQWIAFIDHDDIISKKYLEYLYSKIDNENEIDAICCGSKFLSDDFSFDEEQIGKETIYSSGREILNKKYDEKHTALSIWAKLLRKDILLSLEINKYKNIYSRSWFEDKYVSPFYYFECRKVIFIDNVLYGYRYDENSLSHAIIDAEYYANRPGCDEVLSNKYFQMNMYEKAWKVMKPCLFLI